MAKSKKANTSAGTYQKSWRPEGFGSSDHKWIGIYQDNRIWYWTGGSKGVGERVVIRGGSLPEMAAAKFRQIVADVERGGSLNVETDTPWKVLFAKWVEEHDDIREGTLVTRKSAIDAVLIPAIGDALLIRTSSATLAQVIDYCLRSTDIRVNRFESVMSTLKVVVKWAVQREYVVRNPFGTPEDVADAIKAGRKRINHVRPSSQNQAGSRSNVVYRKEDVPTWDDVLTLAKSVSNVVRAATGDVKLATRMGAAIRVAAGTGLRECELLSLTTSDVDLKRGFINLWRQADRYTSSHSTTRYAPLKGSDVMDKSNPQRVHVWKKVKNDLQLLVKGANDTGEVFVLPSSSARQSIVAWWEGVLKDARAEADIDWRPHMLRHHYGSYSTASRDEGGMGMSYATVQKSMGHKNLNTTMDTYIHSVRSTEDGWVE